MQSPSTGPALTDDEGTAHLLANIEAIHNDLLASTRVPEERSAPRTRPAANRTPTVQRGKMAMASTKSANLLPASPHRLRDTPDIATMRKAPVKKRAVRSEPAPLPRARPTSSKRLPNPLAAENQALKAEIASLRAELAAVDDGGEAAEVALGRYRLALRESRAAANDMAEECEKYKAQCKKLSAQLESLGVGPEGAAGAEDNATLRTRVADLKAEVEAAWSASPAGPEIAELRQQLSAALTSRDALVAEIDRVKTLLSGYENQVSANAATAASAVSPPPAAAPVRTFAAAQMRPLTTSYAALLRPSHSIVPGVEREGTQSALLASLPGVSGSFPARSQAEPEGERSATLVDMLGMESMRNTRRLSVVATECTPSPSPGPMMTPMANGVGRRRHAKYTF